MLIGILSDTHDQFARTQKAVELLKQQGAQVLFHCGDLVDPSMVSACGSLPCYYVFGNNDADEVVEIRTQIARTDGGVCLEWGDEVELAGSRIAMTHGHLHTDVRRLLAAKPDYMFSGHSHLAADWLQGPTRRINPGALHRAKRYTVATLDLVSNELTFFEIRS